MKSKSLFIALLLMTKIGTAQMRPPQEINTFGRGQSQQLQGQAARPLITQVESERSIKGLSKSKQLQAQQTELMSKLFSGPGTTGGGNFDSMVMRALIESLPEVLRAKGLEYFPEIDIQELEGKVASRILIATEHPIVINKELKAARFDQSNNAIYFSVPEIRRIVQLQTGVIQLQALLLHEVLGLMGLESNMDYRISNRIIGLASLESFVSQTTRNQITPMDPEDAQVIYWKTNNEGYITFFYCKNRDRINTCHILGRRTYSQKELSEYFQKIQIDLNRNTRTSRNLMFAQIGSSVSFVVGMAVWAVPAGAVVAIPAAIAWAAFHLYLGKKSEIVRDKVTTQENWIDSSKQLVQLQSGVTNQQDFQSMVQGIHQFLLSVGERPNHSGSQTLEINRARVP